jgi:thioredoxin 1
MLNLTDVTFKTTIISKGAYVIDFMADWCQPCKGVSEMLNQLEKQYPKVVFVKVNVDKSPQTAEQYNIGALPTVLFIIDGQPTTVLTGNRVTQSKLIEILKLVQNVAY